MTRPEDAGGSDSTAPDSERAPAGDATLHLESEADATHAHPISPQTSAETDSTVRPKGPSSEDKPEAARLQFLKLGSRRGASGSSAEASRSDEQTLAGERISTRRLFVYGALAAGVVGLILLATLARGGTSGSRAAGSGNGEQSTAVPVSPTAGPAATATVAPTPVVAMVTLPMAPPSAPAPPSAATGPSPAERLAEAERLLEAGEWSAAVGQLEQLLSDGQRPDGLEGALARGYAGRGQERLAAGDFDGAAGDFAAARDLGDPAAEAGLLQVELARHYAAAEAAWGQHDEVVLAELEAVYSLDPAYREVSEKLYAALISRAERQAAGGDLEGARVALARAIGLAPERTEAYDQLAALNPQPEPAPVAAPGGGPAITRSGFDPRAYGIPWWLLRRDRDRR